MTGVLVLQWMTLEAVSFFSMELMIALTQRTPQVPDLGVRTNFIQDEGIVCDFTAKKCTLLWHTVSLLWGDKLTPILQRAETVTWSTPGELAIIL